MLLGELNTLEESKMLRFGQDGKKWTGRQGQEKVSSLFKPWKGVCASGRTWSCHLRPLGCSFDTRDVVFWLSGPHFFHEESADSSCCLWNVLWGWTDPPGAASVPGSGEVPWCLWSPEIFNVLAPKRGNRAGRLPTYHLGFHSFPSRH